MDTLKAHLDGIPLYGGSGGSPSWRPRLGVWSCCGTQAQQPPPPRVLSPHCWEGTAGRCLGLPFRPGWRDWSKSSGPPADKGHAWAWGRVPAESPGIRAGPAAHEVAVLDRAPDTREVRAGQGPVPGRWRGRIEPRQTAPCYSLCPLPGPSVSRGPCP